MKYFTLVLLVVWILVSSLFMLDNSKEIDRLDNDDLVIIKMTQSNQENITKLLENMLILVNSIDNLADIVEDHIIIN